ncbi:SEC14-like protein 2 [Atheta coriaria]|uniref:SEC14-like protein 2 n=1 Tax=Dalotia coriaria TaxID=877792 RepID=UPI0031F45F76
MFRESMNWRQQWGVDGYLRTWQPGEVMDKYIAYGVIGTDPEGCPIAIIPIKGVDIVGILHSVSRHDFIRFAINVLETTLEKAAKRGQHEIVVIFDMEGFQLRPYAWRPATQLVISMIQMYEANYPESLKACFVINAPRVFAFAFNVIKPFLDEYTISKISVFKSDPRKYQKAMKECIPDDQLPVHYGGTMVDPDGDPKCPSKINYGGTVPKSFYKKNFEQDKKRDYTDTSVKSGGKIVLVFNAPEEGCYLNWDFVTEDHDIKFGVTCKDDATGHVHQVIKAMRVPSHQVEESGALQCKPNYTYTVTFDNTYSMFKNKKIKYSVYMTEPITKLDMSVLPANEE